MRNGAESLRDRILIMQTKTLQYLTEMGPCHCGGYFVGFVSGLNTFERERSGDSELFAY